MRKESIYNNKKLPKHVQLLLTRKFLGFLEALTLFKEDFQWDNDGDIPWRPNFKLHFWLSSCRFCGAFVWQMYSLLQWSPGMLMILSSVICGNSQRNVQYLLLLFCFIWFRISETCWLKIKSGVMLGVTPMPWWPVIIQYCCHSTSLCHTVLCLFWLTPMCSSVSEPFQFRLQLWYLT